MINLLLVNIYFTLAPAQVYNISDHCFVAILVGFGIIYEQLSEISESVKDVSVQSIHNLVIVVKFTFQIFSNSRQNPTHASKRDRDESLELHSIL